MSPNARALRYYRGMGCECIVLERWIPHTKIRQDIWGADILVRQGQKLIAVQATDGTNHSKRVTKVLGASVAVNWLKGGVAFEVFSESLRGARYKKKLLRPRVTQLTLNGKEQVVVLSNVTWEEEHRTKAEDTPA